MRRMAVSNKYTELCRDFPAPLAGDAQTMTQSIVVQVGQCGNQIGCRFWDLALKEHSQHNKGGVYDEPISCFFRNVDMRHGSGSDLPLGAGRGKISSLKARAVLVDMEEGVVNGLLRGPLGEVFDHQQLITDVSGSGNNWATGNKMYGDRYQDQIVETVRKSAEQCDCLQSFFILHSMGGGTGSGIGTKVLEVLQDGYPEVYRFVTAVYPSDDDDVITSPYNSVLAMHQLTERADCVFPIENQALIDICSKVSKACPSKLKQGTAKPDSTVASSKSCVQTTAKPFDSMNNIAANLLLNLTSASRFEGSLNVDLNEITMNLVPYPKMHYLVSSITPLYALQDVSLPPRRRFGRPSTTFISDEATFISKGGSYNNLVEVAKGYENIWLDQMFSDAFSREHQLIKADPKNSLYLACALMLRGRVEVSDIRRNIDKWRQKLHFVHWNEEGWKTGLCSVPPVGQPYSLLTLSNNTCFQYPLRELRDRFNKLFKRKAHLHHYTRVEGMEEQLFHESLESLSNLIDEYQKLEAGMGKPVDDPPRLLVM